MFLLVVGVVEVVKGMTRLGVSPDLETLATYILPVFPSLEAALKTLQVIDKVSIRSPMLAERFLVTHKIKQKTLLSVQDSGVSVDSEAFVCAEIRTLAASNLAKVYTLSKSTHIDSNGVFNKV